MNKTILIVDDEIHIRALLEQTLEDLEDKGVELIALSNGMEALDVIKTEQPELVFLDVMMPEMNGYEVCRYIKRTLNLSQTFVVLLTAKGQETDQRQGLEAGADIYMTKPFDPDEVLATAEEVLGV